MNRFYIKWWGKISGPYRKEELEKKFLFPGTLLKQEGASHWLPLSETGSLYDLLPAARKRQILTFTFAALCLGAILFLILFLTRFTYTEIIEQNIKCKEEPTVALPQGSTGREEKENSARLPSLPLSIESYLPSLTPSPLIGRPEHAKKIHLAFWEARKASIRNHFDEYIKICNSSFNADETGVSNVHVIVENHTVFLIDEIRINVQYMDEKGTVISIVPVQIQPLKPLCREDREAPPDNKASRVSFLITYLYAKELNLCFPPKAGKNHSDPFRCQP